MATDRELKVLHLLATSDAATQRQVADASGFSLGLVNNIVRRLIETGHIKVHNLTAKRVRYILTPKGVAEKARQSYDYLRSTVKAYNACLRRIHQIVSSEIQSGKRRFVVIGDGEIADLVETALQFQAGVGVTYKRSAGTSGVSFDSAISVLDCRSPHGRNIGISVLSALLHLENAPVAGKRAASRLFGDAIGAAK